MHGDQAKRRIALMILQPPCPAATEVAQTIKNNHSVRDFHFRGSQRAREVTTGDGTSKERSPPTGEAQ